MPSNFVINYSGREGSSAVINSLGWQRDVCVPLLEDLDLRNYRRKHPAFMLYKKLAEVFESGVYKEADPNYAHPAAQHFASGRMSVGFKWRVFGNIEKIARVFAQHNVVVFQLSRRDFLSLVCSDYTHTYARKIQSKMAIDPHPQFQLRKLSEAERNDYSEQISELDFRLKKSWFLKSAKEIARIKAEQRANLQVFAAAGVKVRSVYYENFDMDKEAFIKSMMAELGLDTTAAFNPNCTFYKVHKRPITERIEGLSAFINSSNRYKKYERTYNQVLEDFQKLSGIPS